MRLVRVEKISSPNMAAVLADQPRDISGLLACEHAAFEPPEHALRHIIWNLYLVDKDEANSPDFPAVLQQNDAGLVVAILPRGEPVPDLGVDAAVIPYDGHEPVLDLEAFRQMGERIEDCRRQRRNVFLFCNKGYQRSLPFLCYFLKTFHPDEVPTIERFVDLVLPQVARAEYAARKQEFVASLTKLFGG